MAAGAANVTRGTAFAATLAAERTVLDVPPEVPGGTSMGQVSIAAEKVALGATKIQMCFSGGNDVPETVAVPLFKEFHTQIIAFLAFAVSSLGSNGATFDEGVVRATKLVSQSCANFVVVATATTAPSPNLKPSLAEVWSSCAAFKKLPKDGRAAVSKALMRSAMVVKDVVDELATISCLRLADGSNAQRMTSRRATRTICFSTTTISRPRSCRSRRRARNSLVRGLSCYERSSRRSCGARQRKGRV